MPRRRRTGYFPGRRARGRRFSEADRTRDRPARHRLESSSEMSSGFASGDRFLFRGSLSTGKGFVLEASSEHVFLRHQSQVVEEAQHAKDVDISPERCGRIAGFDLRQGRLRDSGPDADDVHRKAPAQAGVLQALAESASLLQGLWIEHRSYLRHNNNYNLPKGGFWQIIFYVDPSRRDDGDGEGFQRLPRIAARNRRIGKT